MAETICETDLYPPVKTYLQAQGYEVKGEIGAADLVAIRGGDDPVIVELKTRMSLSLFHQCIARQSITDYVYMAVPRAPTRAFAKSLKANISLARRLGLGLLTVRLRDGYVEAHCDPGPYLPRKNKTRQSKLLREFHKRTGDPTKGGATRSGLITAYRQDALQCAALLAARGPTKGAIVAKETGVAKATRLMADDHYGWFERVDTGIYQLTPKGVDGLKTYSAMPKS